MKATTLMENTSARDDCVAIAETTCRIWQPPLFNPPSDRRPPKAYPPPAVGSFDLSLSGLATPWPVRPFDSY